MLNTPPERRVLVVAEALGYGGTEAHLVAVLPRLVQSGLDISVFCLGDRGPRAAELEQGGIRVISASPLANRRKQRLLYPLQAGLDCRTLYAFARAWRPDVAHFFLPGPYLLGAPVAIAAQVPVKVMSRRSLAHYQQNWLGARQAERLLHKRMTAILGNCRAILEELAEEGVPAAKLRLIYNGIDASMAVEPKEAARAALGFDPQALIGIVVANLIPYKGHSDLIEALAIARPKLPDGWQVLCVGAANDLKLELEALASERGIAANIRFLGQRFDVDRLLQAADYGVLPSRANEGFSNAILESMRAGLPMVVTDVGGNAEAVVDGETGFVVPRADPGALAAALIKLVEDASLRQRLGAAGRKRLTTKFTLEACVAQYQEFYDELLTGLSARQRIIKP
jgi:glycosyltransferase involved in cell wall biosynthesis